MPKQKLKQVNAFEKGLLTEVNPIVHVPGASKSEANYELNRDGTRDRRYGIAHDVSSVFGDTEDVPYFNGPWTYVWENPGGVNNTYFICVVWKTTLKIYDDEYTLKHTFTATNTITSISTVSGKLVVASGDVDVISYTSSGSVFTDTNVTLTVRDVWGVENASDDLEEDPSYRPAAMTDTHRYNLQNQSWGIERKKDGGTILDPIDAYGTDLSVFPSNSEQVWVGMAYRAVSGGDPPFEQFYTNLYKESFGIKTKAPKGYFIIDLLDRGASREAAVAANLTKYSTLTSYTPSFPDDQSEGGPTVVGSMAGRIFYTGFTGQTINGDERSPFLGDMVFFSRLIKNLKDFGKCYQEGDPTSREESDVVDTDGGYIKINGMAEPLAISNIGDHLIVLAKNGIWTVSSDEGGFRASNYKVSKLSSDGIIGRHSLVNTGQGLMYAGVGGFFAIAYNQYKELVVNNVSSNSIGKLYNTLNAGGGIYAGVDARSNIKGTFDRNLNKVRWVAQNGAYTYEIVLDVGLSAFTINRTHLTICSVIGLPISVSSDGFSRNITRSSVVLLTIYLEDEVNYLAFSRYSNTSFVDDLGDTTEDANAFLITGDNVVSDVSVKKQIPYLTVVMRSTETGFDSEGVLLNTSSCLVSSRWDWAYDERSNKISPAYQMYRPGRIYFPSSLPSTEVNPHETLTTRNKIRGIGKSFAIMFETEAGKDCRLVGWSNSITGNANE